MSTTPRPAAAARRLWMFRLSAAALAPLLCFLIAEGLLRWSDFGFPTAFLVRHPIDGLPRQVSNPEFGKRFFPPGLARPPRPLALPTSKPPGGLRVFVFGESAAMGDPDPRFGLPRLLEVLLRERFPKRPVEVVNAAVVAINSHVVLPVVRECASQSGDVWIVYMGNNEMIGPFGPITVFGGQTPPLPLIRANLAFKSTRVGQAFDALTRALLRQETTPTEWGGMSMMASQRLGPDDPRLERAYAHFESNLEAILATARRAGVQVILCTVATNLKDCAPFASVHRRDLHSNQLASWDELYRRGVASEAQGDFGAAIEAYRQASVIDDRHAELAFRWATSCAKLGQTNEAGRLFHRARDLDALQFRADSRINGTIRRAAARHANWGVQLLDAEAWIASLCPDGLPGREFFYEHVHFTPAGNYQLARAAAEHLARLFPGNESTPHSPPIQSFDATQAPAVAADNAPDEASSTRNRWLSEAECLRRAGFTEWNRHHILIDVLQRVRSPPFPEQAYHDRDVQRLQEQINGSRLAAKPNFVNRAVEQVARLVERHPEEPDLRWVLAELLEADGAKPQAETQWREILQRWPLAYVPAFNLARLLESSGRTAEAVAVYGQCLASEPDYVEARHRLGVALAGLGQLPEGLRHLKRAVRQRPRSLEVRMDYGRILFEAGSRAAARHQFEEILRLDPSHAEARQRLESP